MMLRNILATLTFFMAITTPRLFGSEFDTSFTSADLKTIDRSTKWHNGNVDETMYELPDSIPVKRFNEKIKNVKKGYNNEGISKISKLRKILKNTKQLLIVISKDWDVAQGNLNYYENKNDRLLKMSENIPVNLGSSGLGWGNGLIDFDKSIGPIKREGDGKSPAGIFSLSYSFGYLPLDSLNWLKYPYKQVTSKIECVDDTSSKYYNTLVNTETTVKTWISSEIMRSRGIHYKFGIFVDHNFDPPIPGCGSCIFIHIWDGLGIPTAGCTSLSEEQILKLLHWIDVKKKPLLIQLPEMEFNKLKLLLK